MEAALISESKMMNTRNSYYNKRKNSRQIERELGGGKLARPREEANWANHGWTSRASGKRLRAVKWNVGAGNELPGK